MRSIISLLYSLDFITIYIVIICKMSFHLHFIDDSKKEYFLLCASIHVYDSLLDCLMVGVFPSLKWFVPPLGRSRCYKDLCLFSYISGVEDRTSSHTVALPIIDINSRLRALKRHTSAWTVYAHTEASGAPGTHPREPFVSNHSLQVVHRR